MELQEAIIKRRTVRDFSDKLIDPAIITAALSAGIHLTLDLPGKSIDKPQYVQGKNNYKHSFHCIYLDFICIILWRYNRSV